MVFGPLRCGSPQGHYWTATLAQNVCITPIRSLRSYGAARIARVLRSPRYGFAALNYSYKLKPDRIKPLERLLRPETRVTQP